MFAAKVRRRLQTAEGFLLLKYYGAKIREAVAGKKNLCN
jgi:hypothetical protein